MKPKPIPKARRKRTNKDDVEAARVRDWIQQLADAATVGAAQDQLAADRKMIRDLAGLKAWKRILGKQFSGKGECWDDFKTLQLLESIPGRGPVRLDNSLPRQIVLGAIETNDWELLHALCYWQKQHHSPKPDLLTAFIVEHWRHRSDEEIAAKANENGFNTTTVAVRDQRRRLGVKRLRKGGEM